MLRKIRCRHSTRSSGGGGRSQLSSALETANEAASMPNGTGGAIANSRPPVIGPPSSFMTISAPIMRPFASGSASRPTTWGISVWDELRKNVSHGPIRKKHAESASRPTAWVMTSTVKPASRTARNASTRAIARRRSTRSMSTPAGKLNSKYGKVSAAVTPAMSRGSLVSVKASSGPAVSAVPSPAPDTALAHHSFANSRPAGPPPAIRASLPLTAPPRLDEVVKSPTVISSALSGRPATARSIPRAARGQTPLPVLKRIELLIQNEQWCGPHERPCPSARPRPLRPGWSSPDCAALLPAVVVDAEEVSRRVAERAGLHVVVGDGLGAVERGARGALQRGQPWSGDARSAELLDAAEGLLHVGHAHVDGRQAGFLQAADTAPDAPAGVGVHHRVARESCVADRPAEQVRVELLG